MDLKKYIADNRIEIIKRLFEVAVQNTVEKCRLDYRLAQLYTTPRSATDWSFEDHRTAKDKMIEDSCEARVILAFELAQPIRETLDFYDLICCAMPYYKDDDERNKYIYNEVIRYTNNEEIRDVFIEKLYKLNLKFKALQKPRLSNDFRKYIVNFDETRNAFNMLLDNCDLPFNPYSITDIHIDSIKRDSSGGTHTQIVELSISGDSFSLKNMCYNNIEVRFKFIDVKEFTISRKYTSVLNIAETKEISGYGDTLTFTCGDALLIQSSKIETLHIRKWTEKCEWDESNQ